MFADVTSANVVGYTNIKTGRPGMAGNTLLALNAFVGVGGVTAQTLGDIAAKQYYDDADAFDYVGFLPKSDFIQTMNENGIFNGKYYYFGPNYIETEGITGKDPGWYADTSMNSCANDVGLDFGKGVVVMSGNGGGVDPEFNFAGEVKGTVTTIPLTPTTLTGNATPATIKLGQIKALQYYDDSEAFDYVGFLPKSYFIQTMGRDGQFSGKYYYFGPNYMETEGITDKDPGWYADTKLETCVNETVSFGPGEAFVVICGNGGGVAPLLYIPTALTKE